MANAMVYKFDPKLMRHAVDQMGLGGFPAISFDRPAAIVIISDKSSRAIAQQVVAGERGVIKTMVHEAHVDRLAAMGNEAPAAVTHRRRTSVSGRMAAAVARERGEHS